MASTSLQVGSNVNARRVNRWGAAVVQREAPPAPYDRNPGALRTVSYAHPLGSPADLHVPESTVHEPMGPDQAVLAKLSGHKRPTDARLGMEDRTWTQPVLALRNTSYCSDYCAAHISAASGDPTGGAPAARRPDRDLPIPVELQGLTASQLDHVARFGVLPEGESKSKLKPLQRETAAWLPE